MALSEEEIGKVKQGLSSSFWNDVVVPKLAQRGNQSLRALTLYPGERNGDYSKLTDDQIRAQIKEVEWMLSVWKNEVAVFDENRRQEELLTQQNGANPQE